MHALPCRGLLNSQRGRDLREGLVTAVVEDERLAVGFGERGERELGELVTLAIEQLLDGVVVRGGFHGCRCHRELPCSTGRIAGQIFGDATDPRR